jgi:hypothetical protein
VLADASDDGERLIVRLKIVELNRVRVFSLHGPSIQGLDRREDAADVTAQGYPGASVGPGANRGH